MKILVLNSGSSSIKYKLFDMDSGEVLASGLAESIGEKNSILSHTVVSKNNDAITKELKTKIKHHKQGLSLIVAMLVDPVAGVIEKPSDITAIGHRVVHGGERFTSPTIIDGRVVAEIKKNIPLAPLHNAANLSGIEVALSIFPSAGQVAVFDTAFHQTIPPKAFLYALPYAYYKEKGVRRYGFHGTSHAYVMERYATYFDIPLEDVHLITLHLGNGASMAAIKNGRCVDTTMGMTPLEGLVMGTRSGDLDPSLPFYLARHLNMSLEAIETLFNTQSGLKGICGSNDMREILKRRTAGDPMAELAVEIYCYRIKKYIGAYSAILGKIDGIIFTAGIGENDPDIRAACCKGLAHLGIVMDRNKNSTSQPDIKEIQCDTSRVKIMVIPTDEELKIAHETRKLMEK